MNRIVCAHCGRDFLPNPRVINQCYCNRPECQRARKSLWQRQKLAADQDYQANQRDCWKNWRQLHHEYWQYCRQQHPQVQERNRLQQRVLNTKRNMALNWKGFKVFICVLNCFLITWDIKGDSLIRW